MVEASDPDELDQRPLRTSGTLLGPIPARESAASRLGRDAARAPAAQACYGAGVIECPEPARIWSPCWGVHDVVDGGLRCVVDALSGVCLRRTASPFTFIAAPSSLTPLTLELVEDMSTTQTRRSPLCSGDGLEITAHRGQSSAARSRRSAGSTLFTKVCIRSWGLS